MSECTQSEDTYDRAEDRRYVDPSKINIKRSSHNHVFSMQTNTLSSNTLEQIDLNRQKAAAEASSPNFAMRENIAQEDQNLTKTQQIKRAQSSGLFALSKEMIEDTENDENEDSNHNG